MGAKDRLGDLNLRRNELLLSLQSLTDRRRYGTELIRISETRFKEVKKDAAESILYAQRSLGVTKREHALNGAQLLKTRKELAVLERRMKSFPSAVRAYGKAHPFKVFE